MSAILTEELNIYVDDDTGDQYLYNGKELVLVRKGFKQIGEPSDPDWVDPEEEQRMKEAEANGTLESQEELENRLKKIEDKLNDPNLAKACKKEAKARKAKAELQKAAKDAEKELRKFNESPLFKFRGTLDKFIKSQVKMYEERSYSRFNRKYDDSGIIRKGVKKKEIKHKPHIQVYYDRSGSWDAEWKQKLGDQAIAALHKYVRAKKITVEIFYFDTKVSKNASDCGGGTNGTPILANITSSATPVDNVIVVTDSDITDCRSKVTVPGVVMYLFVDGVSDNLREHLRGATETKSFEITEKQAKDALGNDDEED